MTDLFTGRLTWRRAVALIQNLPPDSATVRSLDPAAQWTVSEHLLAHIADVLAAANWQRGGDKNAARPTPLPRPGQQTETRLSGAEIERRLLEQRKR